MKMNMKKRQVLFAFCFAAFGLVILRPAAAATGFEKLPGEQGKTSPLLMRIVQYEGTFSPGNSPAVVHFGGDLTLIQHTGYWIAGEFTR